MPRKKKTSNITQVTIRLPEQWLACASVLGREATVPTDRAAVLREAIRRGLVAMGGLPVAV